MQIWSILDKECPPLDWGRYHKKMNGLESLLPKQIQLIDVG